MKKFFTLFLVLVMLFSCSERRILKDPETSSPGQEKEIKQENLENKENLEELTQEIIFKKCKNYSSFPSFYFFVDDVCYSLGIQISSSDSQFFLTSSRNFRMVEHYIGDYTGEIESFDNLFSENIDYDQEKWYEKYNYKYVQIPLDFTIYNDIPKQYAKVLKKYKIEKLPENYLKLDFLGDENKNFQKVVKEEKEFIKDGITGKIDYSKIENLDLENLYEDVKKELEVF